MCLDRMMQQTAKKFVAESFLNKLQQIVLFQEQVGLGLNLIIFNK